MLKKIYFILTAVIIVIISGYLYLRYKVLKAKEFVPDTSMAKSALDLRPAIIAKLQQLVKDGSGGLYKLSVNELDLDVISSKLKLIEAALVPDSTVLARLEKARTAPDDVFKITSNTLNIEGIGIDDLLNKDDIKLKKIYFKGPVVEVYHNKRLYNKEQRIKLDSLTLYQLLLQHVKSISIDTILVEHGKFINHNISGKDKISTFNDVTVKMSNILVDSTTQYVRDRFWFAKDADIGFKDYALSTPDSLYYFKAGSINISAANKKLNALNVALLPRGSRAQFIKKLKHRKDMFTVKVPKITLDQIDWYSILNEEKVIVKEATIESFDFSDYFDRTVPLSNSVSGVSNFPHQLLMRMDLPVYIEKIHLRDCTVKYEEFSPAADASGIISFDKVNGQLSNVTNMPEYIRSNSKMKLSVTALFLNSVNFKTVFSLDLKNYRKGNFAVDVTLGSIGKELINPVAEPLGLISIKRGEVNKVIAHVEGTNHIGKGKILLLYNDLHLVPLKEDKDGGVKKRKFTAFLANLLLVKNDNPARGKEPREENCEYKKDDNGSFFNFIWKIILTGILKTVGIPQKFAYK